MIEDITSWGTRFGGIGRGAQNLWIKWWGDEANATRMREYITAKFERHLFSDKDLAALIDASLNQFRDDLKANQNRLHADIKSAWQSKTYAHGELDIQGIVTQVNQDVIAVSQTMGTDSVTVGVLAFIGGFDLEQATEALVKIIIGRVATYVATSAATTTAASGGAAGTAAAAGGAGGSRAGPIGTVIGVAAGIVVGVVADWWMTKEIEQKLTAECEDLLSQVQAQVLVGSNGAPGLKHAFAESITTVQKAEESALNKSFMKMAK